MCENYNVFLPIEIEVVFKIFLLRGKLKKYIIPIVTHISIIISTQTLLLL